MENNKNKVPFKSVDDVKQDFTNKVNEFGLEPGVSQPMLEFLLEENRQAWIRGKEYGWKKAWNWKRQGARQAA